jgi:hypothetical protein
MLLVEMDEEIEEVMEEVMEVMAEGAHQSFV